MPTRSSDVRASDARADFALAPLTRLRVKTILGHSMNINTIQFAFNGKKHKKKQTHDTRITRVTAFVPLSRSSPQSTAPTDGRTKGRGIRERDRQI